MYKRQQRLSVTPTGLGLDVNLTNLEIEQVTTGAGILGDDRFDATGKSDLRVIIYSNAGDDQIFGSELNDDLRGQDGNDLIEGNGGGDRIEGSRGDDILRGGDGNDTIYGDFQLTNGSFSEAREGDDILEGGAGIDNLIGGGGDDRLCLLYTSDAADE